MLAMTLSNDDYGIELNKFTLSFIYNGGVDLGMLAESIISTHMCQCT